MEDKTFTLNALEFLFIIVTCATGTITIIYSIFGWLLANRLYEIDEQELLDKYGDLWLSYTKYYKWLGITFKIKKGPFRANATESVSLRVESRRLKDLEEELRLKESLKPVIKLNNK
jgi:hypothetical protein